MSSSSMTRWCQRLAASPHDTQQAHSNITRYHITAISLVDIRQCTSWRWHDVQNELISLCTAADDYSLFKVQSCCCCRWARWRWCDRWCRQGCSPSTGRLASTRLGQSCSSSCCSPNNQQLHQLWHHLSLMLFSALSTVMDHVYCTIIS